MSDLFSWKPRPQWADKEQAKEARRVGGAIGEQVLAFCRRRSGQEFHMVELRQHIGDDRAPDSAGRILRLLRQAGLVDYSVVNRRQSLYLIKEVGV